MAAALHRRRRACGWATGSPASRRRSTTCTTRGRPRSGPRADRRRRAALPRRPPRPASCFRPGELSPVELLDAVVARTRRSSRPSTRSPSSCSTRRTPRPASPRRATRAATVGRVRSRGCPLLLKEEQPIAGRTIEEGSLLEKGRVADGHPPGRGARLRGRCGRARPDHDARVLLRAVHALHAVGRHPQPVEHRALPRRLLGRVGRGAGRRCDRPGDRVGHRRVDPAARPRCAAWSGFKPPFGRDPGAAAVQPGHVLRGRADGPHGSPTSRCCRTCSPVPTRSTRPRCGPPTAARAAGDVARPAGRAVRPRSATTSSTRGRGEHPGRGRRQLRAAGARGGGRAAVDPRAAGRHGVGALRGDLRSVVSS